jgi:integrase
MAKTLHRLTAIQVKAAHSGTNLNDGGGLTYRTDKAPGTGQWKFRFTSHDPDFVARQTARGSKTRQRDMGLGTFPTTPLADARKKAATARAAVDAGRDPMEDARRDADAAHRNAADVAQATATQEMTFGRYAVEQFLPTILKGLTNPAHIQQWRSTFAVHAAAILDIPLADVSRADVLGVLRPIWETKNVTASRSRGRIERLFAHATQNGHFTGDNPAAWTLFDHTLTPPRKLTRGHHAAIPHKDAATFMEALRSRQAGSMAAQMLEWIMLAACRTGEARFATWDEIDLERNVWTIPAERMKMRRGHDVPVTERMVAILADVKRQQDARGIPCEYIFTNDKGKPLSEMAALMFMRRLPGFEAFTVHGLRATFKGWVGTERDYPRELIEEQLAHQVGAVERAYLRLSAVDRRRPIMEDWSAYCDGQDTSTPSASVASIKSGTGGVQD